MKSAKDLNHCDSEWNLGSGDWMDIIALTIWMLQLCSDDVESGKGLDLNWGEVLVEDAWALGYLKGMAEYRADFPMLDVPETALEKELLRMGYERPEFLISE